MSHVPLQEVRGKATIGAAAAAVFFKRSQGEGG